MRKIEVRFPEIKGMKVSGATLDFENGCSVVEYVKKVEFKKGDYVKGHIGNSQYLAIYDVCFIHISEGNPILLTAPFAFNKTESINAETMKPLFNALAKEGKYWDEEALEVKEFEKVPDNIGIYRCDRTTAYDKGDELYIGFNDNKQILSTSNGIYTVNLNDADIYCRVNCYLRQISHEDVRVGDTILCGGKEYLTSYFKVIENGCAYTSDENDVFTLVRFGSRDKLFKLIPIK